MAFEPRELVARIHAVLPRSRGGVVVKEDKGLVPVARFQGWTFDRVKRRVTSPDEVMVDLSSAELRLLSVLVDHAGQVLSRDRLLDMTQPPGAILSDRSG